MSTGIQQQPGAEGCWGAELEFRSQRTGPPPLRSGAAIERFWILLLFYNQLFTNDHLGLENHINQPIMLLKSGLFFTLCVFTLHASQVKGKNPGWNPFLFFSYCSCVITGEWKVWVVATFWRKLQQSNSLTLHLLVSTGTHAVLSISAQLCPTRDRDEIRRK